MVSRVLWTFGYERVDIDAFLRRLVDAGADLLVDVRALPLSRKKGFSKAVFSERLAEVGIEYLHRPALGCPKPIRDRYRADSDWARYTRDFMAHLAARDADVRALAAIAKTSTVCLMCFEEDFSRCHRTYVARAAHAAGAPAVQHLTLSTVVPDTPARVAGEAGNSS
jgi:uncharacterized protein (DUF488 family)